MSSLCLHTEHMDSITLAQSWSIAAAVIIQEILWNAMSVRVSEKSKAYEWMPCMSKYAIPYPIGPSVQPMYKSIKLCLSSSPSLGSCVEVGRVNVRVFVCVCVWVSVCVHMCVHKHVYMCICVKMYGMWVPLCFLSGSSNSFPCRLTIQTVSIWTPYYSA